MMGVGSSSLRDRRPAPNLAGLFGTGTFRLGLLEKGTIAPRLFDRGTFRLGLLEKGTIAPGLLRRVL